MRNPNNVVLQPNYYPSTPEQQQVNLTNYAQIFADQNARNQQANALNARLEQRQREGRTPLDDWNDKRIAEIQAQKANPIYQKEQEKKDLIANLQGVGKAMQDAQTTNGYTYNGLDAHQLPDGSYFVRDAQGNDIAIPQDQLKPKYSIDRGQALVSMLNVGNPQALAMFGATQDKESGKLSFAEQLALKQAEGDTKQAQWEAKQQVREAAFDDKMTGYSKAKDILGDELTPFLSSNTKATEKARNIIGQALVDPRYRKADVIAKAQEAKDKGSNWFKKDFDEDYFTKVLESLNR